MDLVYLLYIISISLGTAVSLVLTAISIRFLKDFKISKKENKTLIWINNIFWVVLVLSFFINLHLVRQELYSERLKVTLILMIIMMVNYVLLNLWVGPKLIDLRLNFTCISVKRTLMYRQIALALSATSLITWLSVLDFSTSNFETSAGFLYISYISYIVIGVTLSQLFPLVVDKIATKKV